MAKKSFKDDLTENPALRFITPPQEATGGAPKAQEDKTPTPPPQSAPTGLLRATPRAESKSKHVQLLIRPSVYNKALEEAGRLGLSFNEYAHRLLEKGGNSL